MKKCLLFCTLTVTLIAFLFSETLPAQSTFYKKYDFPGDDFGKYVIQTSDGGYAVVGTTNSRGAGGYDVLLIVTDANGDSLWTKTYGETGNDEGYCLIQTGDGGFIITATKDVPGKYGDGWVFKTDAEGEIVWEYLFGTNLGGESASSIVETGDNAYLVSGTLNTKSYLLKIDGEGNVLWEQSYFPAKNSGTSSICKIDDNLYAVAGAFQMSSGGEWYPNMFTVDAGGNLGYQLTYSFFGGGSFNFIINASDGNMIFGGQEAGQNVLYKISSNGLEVWNYKYGSQLNSGIQSATRTSDNNIVIADNSFYASIRKVDNSTGDTLWTRTSYLGTEYPKYTGITTTSDNGLIITGYTDGHDVILVKTMQNGSMEGVGDNRKANNGIVLNNSYPNPFVNNTGISFKLEHLHTVKLFITDNKYKPVCNLVNKPLSPGEYKYYWDGKTNNGADCPAGIYYLILKTEGGIAGVKKLIKM